MKKLVLILLTAGSCLACRAQHELILKFNHRFPADKTITVTKWKYYISHLRLLGGGKNFEVDTVFLADAFLPDSLIVKIPHQKFTALEFALGVDTITNARGIQEGALDPVNGMYWTWHTGYINWKLEARKIVNGRASRLTHHIGGFLPPNSAYQIIRLPFPKMAKPKKLPGWC